MGYAGLLVQHTMIVCVCVSVCVGACLRAYLCIVFKIEKKPITYTPTYESVCHVLFLEIGYIKMAV